MEHLFIGRIKGKYYCDMTSLVTMEYRGDQSDSDEDEDKKKMKDQLSS